MYPDSASHGVMFMSKIARTFKRGDHVKWNSEAGIVSGTVVKKITSDLSIKGYAHHASKAEPQYMIKSDKTDHVAIHKGVALHHIKPKKQRRMKHARRRKPRR